MTKPIRVTHMITGLNAGGAEGVLLRLLQRMDPGLFLSSVVSLLPIGGLAPEFERLGVPVHGLDMIQGRTSPATVLRARRLIRNLQPDILQSWMYHADLLGAMCVRFPRTARLVWNIRQGATNVANKALLSRFVTQACITMSGMPDAIVACGRNALSNHVSEGYRPERMLCIPNGFDIERFRPSPERNRAARHMLGLNDGDLLVGNVARFHRYKDHPTLISAFSRVAAAVPRSKFLLIGRDVDPDNDLIRSLIPPELESRFLLLGMRSDVSHLLPALDLYASSSIVEGFPNAIGEALACGVPVVATDVGDSRHLVGDAGLIVHPSDPAALASSVTSILSDSSARRADLSGRARRRIVEEFSLDRMVGEYSSLYLRLVGRVHDPALGTVRTWP